MLIDDIAAGKILGIETSTLAVWRSTKRYSLTPPLCQSWSFSMLHRYNAITPSQYSTGANTQ